MYGCLSSKNPLRKICIDIVDERKWGRRFDQVVMALILFNSLWMAVTLIHTPRLPQKHGHTALRLFAAPHAVRFGTDIH